MIDKIEIYLTVSLSDMAKALEIIKADPNCAIIQTHLEDEIAHMTIFGTWDTYKSLLDSKVPMSLEHFEDDI